MGAATPSNSTRVAPNELVMPVLASLSCSVVTCVVPMKVPKMVTISPGATGPPRKLAPFNTPAAVIAGAEPVCVMVNVSDPTIIVPLRAEVVGFVSTAKSTAPLPLMLE